MVLFFGILVVAFSLYRRRRGWRELSTAARRGHWLLLVFLVAVNVTPIFSVPVDDKLIPIGPLGPVQISILSFVPIVLAAGWWGGNSAVVLALVGGFSNAVLKGPHLFLVLEWSLLAGVISFLQHQDYMGGLPALLRRPLPAAMTAGQAQADGDRPARKRGGKGGGRGAGAAGVASDVLLSATLVGSKP